MKLCFKFHVLTHSVVKIISLNVFLRAIVQRTNASRDSHMTIHHLNYVNQHMLGIILIPYLCKLPIVPLRKWSKSEKVENVLSWRWALYTGA